jgi:ACT domain-containing protein
MYINWGTFRNCKNVKSVTLPNSVIEIRGGSFENCGLSSVTIPCTAVGDGPGMFEGILPGAFKGCTNLTSVTNLSCVPQNINFAWFEEPAFEVYGDLHVLKGRKQAYQDAPIWNKFNIIDDIEITPTMVKETIDAIDNVQKVYANDPALKLYAVKALITNARIAFDALNKEQQAQVKNINLLIEAEEAYGESTTGVANINSDNDKKDGKYLENGKIVIKKNDKKFNINGLNE